MLSFAPDLLPLHFDVEADFRAAVMGLVQVSVQTSSQVCETLQEAARALQSLLEAWSIDSVLLRPDPVLMLANWMKGREVASAAAQRGASGQPRQ